MTISTCGDMIQDAYLAAGIGDQYNALDNVTVQSAFRFFNRMLDSWSTEQMTIYGIAEGTFPLIVGTNFYLMGPSANLSLRPTYVRDLSIVDSSSVTYPLRIVGVDEWSEIIYKPAPGRPMVAYLDGNVPSLGMYLYPTPAFSSDIMHVWYGSVIPAFTALTNVLSAPPGYDMAFTLNLAKYLCMINGKPIPEDVKRLAIRTKNAARSTNNQPELLDLDVPMGGGRFNIFTGSYNF